MNPKKLLNIGLQSDTSPGSARLNRAVLFCNVAVLVVNFFLAFNANDVQYGLLRAQSDAGNRVVAGSRTSDVAIPYSRVLQTLDSVAPGQGAAVFTPERLQAIYEAVAGYQSAIRRGVDNLVYSPKGEDLRAAYAALDKDARQEVEAALGSKFNDAALVQRLATEVIRNCR
jgi:hypothetical protein